MLYYTGSTQPNNIQQDPSKSLGGYVSNSIISNGLLNNIFSNVDTTILANKSKQYRIIAFKNMTGGVINSLKLYVRKVTVENFSNIRIGAMLNALSQCGDSYFEQLPTEFSHPLYAQIGDHNDPSQAIEIQNIPADQFVGIFLERSVVESSTPPNPGNIFSSCDVLYQKYKNGEETNPVETDEFEIVLTID